MLISKLMVNTKKQLVLPAHFSYLFIYSFYASLVTKRDRSTNIGFHIMKVDIGRHGELIPKANSGYKHAKKVCIQICLLYRHCLLC